MPNSALKKRSYATDNARPAKRSKIVRRQRAYHSSSEDEAEETEVYGDATSTMLPKDKQEDDAESEVSGDDKEASDGSAVSDLDEPSDSHDSDISETSTNPAQKRKRNDPDVFATSLSKILGSKLTASKRVDPVLARSKAAASITKEQADSKLEEKARRKLRDEKKQAADKGRIRDVIGTEGVEGQSFEEVQELERRLRKTAQRGVVKLFNAVRAAQVKAEQAERDVKQQGVIGVGQREEKINEMSKKGFLDLIAGGGKRPVEVEA